MFNYPIEKLNHGQYLNVDEAVPTSCNELWGRDPVNRQIKQLKN